MYKIRFGFYNSEKAARKRYTCVHFQNSAVFIVQDGESLQKFAKSIDADPSRLENLTSDQVSVVESYLKQQKCVIFGRVKVFVCVFLKESQWLISDNETNHS